MAVAINVVSSCGGCVSIVTMVVQIKVYGWRGWYKLGAGMGRELEEVRRDL